MVELIIVQVAAQGVTLRTNADGMSQVLNLLMFPNRTRAMIIFITFSTILTALPVVLEEQFSLYI